MSEARSFATAPLARDVHALATVTLLLAVAFLSFLGFEYTATVAGSSTVGRLAPTETLGRLWVVFVLLPTTVAFAGIAVPCFLRTSVAVIRNRSPSREARTLALFVACGLLLAGEVTASRNGGISLAATTVVCLHYLSTAALAPRMARAAWVGLSVAATCLMAFSRYQHLAVSRDELSTAVAPTVFLAAYYGVIVGVGSGCVASVSLGRAPVLAPTISAFAVYLAWLVAPGLLAGARIELGADVEPWLTLAAAALIGLSAFLLRRRADAIVDPAGSFH
jgi:hypothetical protein